MMADLKKLFKQWSEAVAAAEAAAENFAKELERVLRQVIPDVEVQVGDYDLGMEVISVRSPTREEMCLFGEEEPPYSEELWVLLSDLFESAETGVYFSSYVKVSPEEAQLIRNLLAPSSSPRKEKGWKR